jgi:multicomponent Na+:H+ antiporter subunit D
LISTNLPVLQVILPLLAAPLCLVLYRPVLVWWFSLVICLATLGISIELLFQVQAGGAISYQIGGWAPPWGIEYRIDALGSYVALIVSGIAAVVMLYAGKSISRELPPMKQTLFYTAYLLCLAGLLGIIVTGDAFNVFVFLEISSLSSYILISLGNDRRALTAAFQ